MKGDEQHDIQSKLCGAARKGAANATNPGGRTGTLDPENNCLEPSSHKKDRGNSANTLARVLGGQAKGSAVYTCFTSAKELTQPVSFNLIILLLVAVGGAAFRKRWLPSHGGGERKELS